jgi:hypothetical protein
MGRRTIPVIEVNEILFRWCQGHAKKEIARSLRNSVNTVKKLIFQAEGMGLKRYISSIEEIHAIAVQLNAAKKVYAVSKMQALIKMYHAQLEAWQALPHMTITQMYRLLMQEGNLFSESALRRYVKKHFKNPMKGTLPLLTVPGREAQVDFGYVGYQKDPKTGKERKSYAFVMTLSHSRYRFVRFVFSQDIKTWIDCHIQAFEFFGSVPAIVVIDNLKSGVVKSDLYDPVINRAYAELERHYGFAVDPTRIRTPRHKGKVERSIPIVRQQVLAGLNHQDIEAANQYALHWCRHEIAHRITRTTGETPWERFERDEKQVLKPLPEKKYECSQWKKAIVHTDHHVVFNGAFYSVPYAYLGQSVWLRGGTKDLKIYFEEKLIKVHCLAQDKEKWVTDEKDYPTYMQQYLVLDKKPYLEKAAALGKSVYDFIEYFVAPLSRTKQRKILALFKLGELYGNDRLNNACRRALSFENHTLSCVQDILKKGLDSFSAFAVSSPPPLEGAYLRDPSEFLS